ncbi:MAG TPA: hypothetical protein EYG93_10850 [Sulfurospirillum arcachonense]|nr:hypothetical protein [Sulfurospirillum arcachonense]
MIIPIIEVLLNTQSRLISAQANYLLKENFYRINPPLPTAIDLDDIEKIDILKNLAIQADREVIVKKVAKLLT